MNARLAVVLGDRPSPGSDCPMVAPPVGNESVASNVSAGFEQDIVANRGDVGNVLLASPWQARPYAGVDIDRAAGQKRRLWPFAAERIRRADRAVGAARAVDRQP
ncbi:MAG: hypothetical protein IPJ30_25610 [Acidobacteria bacterium]|nr:hypothetical protein [Acidobacteriota bacterium]